MRKFLIVFILLAFVGSTLAQEEKNENQVRIFSFGETPLFKNVNARVQPVIPDYVQGTGPLIYAGLSFKVVNKFKIAFMVGNKFNKDSDQLKIAIAPSFKSEKWMFCSQLDYNVGKGNFWNMTQARHFLCKGLLWIGLESENTYGNEEYRSYTIGPNAGIRISKMFCIGATLFQKWSYEKDYSFLRIYLIFNLGD